MKNAFYALSINCCMCLFLWLSPHWHPEALRMEACSYRAVLWDSVQDISWEEELGLITIRCPLRELVL